MKPDELRKKRDQKARAHLEQHAPVWLVAEQFIEADDAVLFNVVFVHPQYGWVNRRYKYDGFNYVLYHKGQVVICEEVALQVQDQEPFVTVTISDIPGSYGG